MSPQEILSQVRKQTPEIILFNSLSGKDSIALTDMCSKLFEKVHCVFLYSIQGLEHMERYRRFLQKVYPNTTWIEYEHYAIRSYKKYGLYGHPPMKKLAIGSLAKSMQDARKQIGVDWIVFGSKQADGLARRLQLKTYEHEAIDYKNNKVFPFSKLTNKDVLKYIQINDLIQPLNYSDDGARSSSDNVTSGIFLLWCKKYFPSDLHKVYEVFPETELILFDYENQTV